MKKILPLALIVVLIILWFGRTPPCGVVIEEKGLPVVYFYGGTSKEMGQVAFDPEMEIVVARSFGGWKVSSIYSLAKNENLGEALVAETIRHNLLLPAKAVQLVSIDGVKFVLARLKYAKNTKVINLSSVTGEGADNLYLEVKSTIFSGPNNFSASIVYRAYDSEVLEKSQKLIESLGFNVFYIKKDNLDADLVCRITGPKRLVSAWVRSTFPDCQRVFDKSDSLTFEFGEKYANTF